MNRGNDMSRGNPVPGFPQTPSAARGWEPTPSAPAEEGLTRAVSPSHECSRPRRPQR
jgi:hypothetical protein